MIKKKPRGRPKKQRDSMTSQQFARVPRVVNAYHAARGRGEKQSVAVTEAAQQNAVSRSEVKRILSAWQSQGAQTVVGFEPGTLTEDDKKRIRFFQEQFAALEGKKGLKQDPTPPPEPKGTIYRIRFAERPTYPRHNRKES